ncbi:hydantoinase/oxoprolinase N-terminal domain-containing protein [Thalassorhabdomicrobium marinisediminis]|uniref:Hydantoinase n=1 Tax=Thalassorhabdomicrobium marinisediminis TaxID=2170577 RepID=A0A2T7FZM6_9RHOB|nr:hydantoinase/oxoprolinase family protein [Thalassorhabdomicrobium marinisediminis]PVA07622.1 hydantoinase [Thalassorhabdomicrobium marinisediminis]
MAVLMGIDTGGTYTDAVLLDDQRNEVIASAKSLTTRPDLSHGIGAAMDGVLSQAQMQGSEVAMVSLSTTLATNALIEGQGGAVALVLIGFEEETLADSELLDALAGDPVLHVTGGHDHQGDPIAPFDEAALLAGLETVSDGVTAFAVASRFATRNPEHEQAARDLIRGKLARPVTCSHDLSKALGGPKRALTAVLNARLVGMIDALIAATEAHMASRGIDARLMVVRGDGALVSAQLARDRPVETILSGPAASVAGAQWLTGAREALVSDIGGTTTDICVLQGGHPKLDPQGAKVGPYRTMVEAVAMRTFGLGGDSEVSLSSGLEGGVMLGPRRVIPVSRFADTYPALVRRTLDHALQFETPPEHATRFVVPQWSELPSGLDRREDAVAQRLASGPLPWADAIQRRVELSALRRLVRRGLVALSDITPTDASRLQGRVDAGNAEIAKDALTVFARRRTANGGRVALSAEALADQIVDALTKQTSFAVLETAFADEGWEDAARMARHSLTVAGLRGHRNLITLNTGLAVPVVGLGASAQCYYGAVGETLGCDAILPDAGGVANAIGAVVGQVALHADGSITSAGEGLFAAHLPGGPQQFESRDEAMNALRAALTEDAGARARAAGVEVIRFRESLDLRESQIETKSIFIEASLRVTALGRPRLTK